MQLPFRTLRFLGTILSTIHCLATIGLGKTADGPTPNISQSMQSDMMAVTFSQVPEQLQCEAWSEDARD